MPLYDYKCSKCGKQFEAVATVEGRHDVNCECGNKADKVFSFRNGLDPFTPYYDDIIQADGVWIESREQRNRILKETKQDIKPASNEFIKRKGRLFFDMGRGSCR